MSKPESTPPDNDPSVIFGKSLGREMYFELFDKFGYDSVALEKSAAGAVAVAAHFSGLNKGEIDIDVATRALVCQLNQEAGAEF